MTGGRGPVDAQLHQQWRRERLAVVRRHHPDRGGDAEVLQQRLEELDRRYAALDARTTPWDPDLFAEVDLTAAPRWQPVTRAVRRTGRSVRRLTRTTRSRIPPGWPGHRRYVDL